MDHGLDAPPGASGVPALQQAPRVGLRCLWNPELAQPSLLLLIPGFPPRGAAHAAALREEGAEQARLRELGRSAQSGGGDEPKAAGGDGSGDATPGTREFGKRLARMAEAAEKTRKA